MAYFGTSLRDYHSVSVAIPAFQAALFLGEVVRRTLCVVPHVLVVDDGSTDETAKIAEEAGARVIRLSRNFGKGRALQTAFTDLFHRGLDKVITLDADGQHLPEEIPKLLKAGKSADLVIGSRAHLFAEMHPIRRTSNRYSSFLISKVAGGNFSDIQSGFRLYSRRLIERTGFPEPRFEAESAAFVRAIRYGFRVVSVPVALGFTNGMGTSHYRPVIDSLRIAVGVTLARWETIQWTQKQF